MDFEVSEKMEIILKMVSRFMRDEVIPLEGEMLHGSSDELARLVTAAQVKVRQMDLWAPNHPVERTATRRGDFDTFGVIKIIGHSLSARSVAVAHPGG